MTDWKTEALNEFLKERPYEEISLKGVLCEKPKFKRSGRMTNYNLCFATLQVKTNENTKFYYLTGFGINARKLGNLSKGSYIGIKGKKQVDWDLGRRHFVEPKVMITEIITPTDLDY